MNGQKLQKDKPSEAALNYEVLQAEGIEHIRRLSSGLWTDHNVHDPGITILELLCYALTDLAYRASLPVEDILASAPVAETDAPFSSVLFPAHEILPSRALTVKDYRKLLINLDGVRNAWLREAKIPYGVDCLRSTLIPAPPDKGPVVPVKGIYDVLLELAPEARSADRIAEITDRARHTLMAHRNLCEDFRTIRPIERQEFILCAEVDIDPGAGVDETAARIAVAVQSLLTPPVRLFSLTEMLARKKRVEEIFEGPDLIHEVHEEIDGDTANRTERRFIDDEELEGAELLDIIELSDVIRTIMGVEGVLTVREVLVVPWDAAKGAPGNLWSIPVLPDHQAMIDVEGARFVLYKDGVPFLGDKKRVAERFKVLTGADDHASALGASELSLPVGMDRQLAEYYSFQNHFPENYGLRAGDLSDTATPARIAQTKQLRAYLLVFDQILADFLAQLSRLDLLFSLAREPRHTYFSQIVKTVSMAEELYIHYGDLAKKLDVLRETESTYAERRNRFLDHLLARFAEAFSDYAWLVDSLFGRSVEHDVIEAKIGFMEGYPTTSANRGTAFDYTRIDDLWDTDNVSGLEQRVGKLLGFKNTRRRNLAQILYDVYDEKDRDHIPEYRFRICNPRKGNKILLSSKWRRLDSTVVEKEMRRAVTLAMDRRNYQRRLAVNGRHYFNLVDETGDIVARRIEYFTTEDALEAAIDDLIDFVRTRYGDEGFFVVEHILLRPEEEGAPFLPVCTGEQCEDASRLDPYSFQVTIVLPAWSERFQEMKFRRFVERTLRLEMPAHILPRICWVDSESMARFENAFRQWLRYKAGDTGVAPGALKRLIDELTSLRSVYPEPGPIGCPEESGVRPFLLDQTVLGTEK